MAKNAIVFGATSGIGKALSDQQADYAQYNLLDQLSTVTDSIKESRKT